MELDKYDIKKKRKSQSEEEFLKKNHTYIATRVGTQYKINDGKFEGMKEKGKEFCRTEQSIFWFCGSWGVGVGGGSVTVTLCVGNV